jgi:hypothetical protein
MSFSFPNNLSAQPSTTVEVYALPVLITVEEDDLDPDTLKQQGRAYAIRETAIAAFYEALNGGDIEIVVGATLTR